MSVRTVWVPASRLDRWIAGFCDRHGARVRLVDGCLALEGEDGSSATLHPAFPLTTPTGDPLAGFVEHVAHPPRCAVVLVRRGGFAVAVVDAGTVEASDIGRRHVQGRTAAGGWSQQRFARRRQKQANELVDAAVDYAARVLLAAPAVEYVVTGGDRALVHQVLDDPRLRSLAALPRGPHLEVPDPRREVVLRLPEQLASARIDLREPEGSISGAEPGARA